MTIITGELMSKKRGMSKQQRLYYEYQNKEKVKEELVEYIKQKHSLEKCKTNDEQIRNILY
jgi:Icc-related predicted phosphoesterase